MQITIKNSNWWRGRHQLGRCPPQVFAFAYLVVLVIVFATAKDANAAEQVCLSAICNRTASDVLAKLKPEISPCDDFYQFACGKYIDERQIPEGTGKLDISVDMKVIVNEQLNNIIQEEAPITRPKHFRLPNQLYKACMNETSIKSLGTNPMKQISDSLGGWPVVVGDSWDRDGSWSWQETIKGLSSFNPNYIIQIWLYKGSYEGEKFRINVMQANLALARKHLRKGLNSTFVSAYYDFMVDIAVLFGAEKKRAQKELKESLQFEIELGKIHWSLDEGFDISLFYNLHSVKEIQESYPYVEWLDYINARLPEGLEIDQNEIICLSTSKFFDRLGSLLQRTDKRVIANYIMWRAHFYSLNFLPEEFRNRQLQFESFVKGTRNKPRWKQCVEMVRYRSPISVRALYVHKYFNQNTKAAILDMIDNLRNTVIEKLDQAQWMDDITKQKTKKKLQDLITYVGCRDEFLNEEKLEEYYRELEINSEKYFESILKINTFDTHKKYNNSLPTESYIDFSVFEDVAGVKGKYHSNEGYIELPAGLFQRYAFDYQQPNYMNYGSMGFELAHSIMMLVDFAVRNYNADGKLLGWWNQDTKKAYLEKAECLIEQYSNFVDKQTGLNLNGNRTKGENIAYNVGAKESYLAYKKWVAENGEEPSLYGLNYTSNQMFWISAAQMYCSKSTTEIRKESIETDEFSPDEFIILGSLRNSKEFAADFQCPEGAPMNPVQKCEAFL